MMGGVAIDLRERVRRERLLRYGSARSAARAGGISNTTWSAWENGDTELGNAVRQAVAVAFDWPADWPESPPPEQPTPADVLSRLSALEQSEVATAIRLRELADAVVELTALSHRHAGRRRGEANVSSRSAV